MSVNQRLSRPCKLRKKFVLSVVVRRVERSRGCNSRYHMVIKIVSCDKTKMAARDRASDRSQKKKSNFTGFLGTKLWKNQLISREFLGANFTKKQLVKNGQFSGYFQGKFHLKLIDFALIRPAFLTFLKQRSSFALSTTIRSRNEPMANSLTSWLVPSFSQHNLCLVVSGRCLHVSATKFQDKFASLRQVNSPYS